MLVTGIILVLIFGGLAVFGVVAHVREAARERTLMQARSTNIREARAGEVIEVSGIVLPSEQGLVTSPVSGQAVALFHTEVLDTAGDSTDLVYTAKDRREFWIKDAEGTCARVFPDDSTMVVTCTRNGATERPEHFDLNGFPRRNVRISPKLLAWAQTVAGHVHSEYVVEERVIAPSDRLHVSGLAERAPDGTLFFRAHASPPIELFLSTYGKTGIGIRQHAASRTLLLALAFTLLFTAAGAVLIILGIIL